MAVLVPDDAAEIQIDLLLVGWFLWLSQCPMMLIEVQNDL